MQERKPTREEFKQEVFKTLDYFKWKEFDEIFEELHLNDESFDFCRLHFALMRLVFSGFAEIDTERENGKVHFKKRSSRGRKKFDLDAVKRYFRTKEQFA